MGRIEIITIGDELIEGRLVDTNAATLSDLLFAAGYRVARHLSVADDRDEIVAALREAAARADVVLVSGGLGPTSDDLTAECAANAFGLPLVRSEEALEHVRQFFAARGREMSPNNAKQADLPAGSTVLPNPWGTAVGFRVTTDRCRLYFMPGVPRELEGIFGHEVLPDLRDLLQARPQRIAVLKVFGTGESDVARLLEGLDAGLARGARLTVQYRATFPEIHVRLVLDGIDGEPADRLLEQLNEDARARLGRHVYASGGTDDDTTFAGRVADELRVAGLTLAVADGCTDGFTSQLLGSVVNADDVLIGALVSNTPATLVGQLAVPMDLFDEHGAVSEPVTEAFADRIRAAFGADLGVAMTGAPATGDDLDGELIVAVSAQGGTRHRRFNFPVEPDRFRQLAAYVALAMVRRAVAAEGVRSQK